MTSNIHHSGVIDGGVREDVIEVVLDRDLEPERVIGYTLQFRGK